MRGGITNQGLAIVSAGDTIVVSSNSGNASQSVESVYSKRKEARVLFDGVARIVYTAQCTEAGVSSLNLQINGIIKAVDGSLGDTSAHVFTHDASVNLGDLIQVWAQTARLSSPITISNFSVKINPASLAVINL